MTFEEKLAQAFAESIKERSERLMNIEKKHRFSLSYKLWERKMLRDLRKGKTDNRWTLKKARYAVVAMVTAVSLLIGGTAFAAVTLGRYNFDNRIDYSKLLIETHPSDKTVIEEYYGLPAEDGWELVDQDVVYFASTLVYKREDTQVTFEQKLIHEGNMGHINTEKGHIEPVSLFEKNDGFVLNFGDEASIYWIYDGYLLQIAGNINKSEAIELVYSTKIIKL